MPLDAPSPSKRNQHLQPNAATKIQSHSDDDRRRHKPPRSYSHSSEVVRQAYKTRRNRQRKLNTKQRPTMTTHAQRLSKLVTKTSETRSTFNTTSARAADTDTRFPRTHTLRRDFHWSTLLPFWVSLTSVKIRFE